MAAAESKTDGVSQQEITKQDVSSINYKNKIVGYKFRIFDTILYTFSIGIILTNIVTDTVVAVEYIFHGYRRWFYFNIGLLLIPTSIIQVLSLKWYYDDGKLKNIHWISHISLLGILYRYVALLREVLRGFNSKYSSENRTWVLKSENDACTLHLFLSFVVSVPQLILQFYLMAIQQSVPFWTGASAAISLCSLSWAISGYIKFKLSTLWGEQKSKWSALIIQLSWRGTFLASRITALVLAALCMERWLFVFLGVHSVIMTLWITFQNTHHRKKWKNCAHNYILGFIYSFDIFLLNSDSLWYRICTFYVVIMVQNVSFLTVYTVYVQGTLSTNIFVLSYVLILGGSLLGFTSMFFYYRKFNYDSIFTDSLQLLKRLDPDFEHSKKSIDSETMKNKKESTASLPSSSDLSHINVLSEEITADKKSLLTNIEHNTESSERGIINSSFVPPDDLEEIPQVIIETSTLDSSKSIQNYEAKIDEIFETKKTDSKIQLEAPGKVSISRENSDKRYNSENVHQMYRDICSAIETDESLDLTNLSLQKRRGICSLTQLGLELVTDVDNYVEKTFSLASSEEKFKLKGFKVVPLPTETSGNDNVPENIKSRRRMNTPVISDVSEATENEKALESNSQKEETMSQITSIHDYENLCPLGVARPPWCIRSWKGYTDIETYIHDDSIVRDRRRDTLTSTATGTTLSSEFSDGTYSSTPSKRLAKNSRQDDYLDTLVYDLADWETNIFPEEDLALKYEVNEDSNLFSAKPVVIDDRGGMLTLDTIVEEHEELTSSSEGIFDPKRQTAVSSLVATIDEIRKYTAENSPRHIYHRTEKQYEDLNHSILMTNSRFNSLPGNEFNNVDRPENPWNLFIRDNSSLDMSDISNVCSRVSMGKTPLISAILSDSPVLLPRTKNEKYTKDEINLLDENNVYVDMKALKTENFSNLYKELNNSFCNVLKEKITLNREKDNLKVDLQDSSFFENKIVIPESQPQMKNISNDDNLCDLPMQSIGPKPDLISVENLSSKFSSPRSGTSLSMEKRRRSICRPRRKFSLLREKFEVKSKQISDQSILNSNKRTIRSINTQGIYDSVVAYEKENLPTIIHKSFEEKADQVEDIRGNLKERRSIFLKQVLSPPKFQSWNKKRIFSPSTEIIPKAL